jgi:LmbE family N-acetylglucosaminyl deacetylase
VVLSPHLDDAVLSCWHVLEGSDDVSVLNVFAGTPPAGTEPPLWDAMTGATDPAERMRERHAEDRAAMALAGCEARSLDLLDAQYRPAPLTAGEVAPHIAEALPSDAALLAPAAINDHPDHRLVRDAALLLAGDGHEVTLYADLPHAIVRGWPKWVTGEPDDHAAGHDWIRTLLGAGLEVEQLVARVLPLDEATRRRKLRALAAYRTQFDALGRCAFAPLDDPRTLGWEITWPVTRATSAARATDRRRSW